MTLAGIINNERAGCNQQLTCDERAAMHRFVGARYHEKILTDIPAISSA